MDLAIKNSDGKRDPVLTLAIVTVAVVLFKFLLSGLVLTITGATVINFGTVDGTVIGALLTPTLGAAVAHRYTDRKFDDANNNGIPDEEETPKK